MQQRPSNAPITTTEIPAALKVFLLASVGLTAFSLSYTGICRWLGLGLPYTFPYYYVPGTMFGDFFDFYKKFHYWGTPAFFDHTQTNYIMYPAPLVPVFHLFFALPHSRTYFIASLLLVTTLVALAFVRVLCNQGLAVMQSILIVATTWMMSYPFLFLIQRWNIEFLTWAIASFGVWCFFIGRTNAAAVFIGVAASMKLYPFIFLGLFLPRRKYGGFVLGLAAFALTTLLALHSIGPTIAQAWRWDAEQIAAFSKFFVGGIWSLGYDHSFFSLLKVATMHWHPDFFAWARPYSIVIAVLSVALYFLRMWSLPLPNQILALSILSVTMAPVSYDYTLLGLYPAFAVLAVLALQAQRRSAEVPHLTTYMVLLALILTPESYIIVHAVRYGAQLRTLCMILMLVLALKTPLPESEPTPSPSLAEA